MASAAALAIGSVVVPFPSALQAETANAPASLVTPDGSFSEIVKLAKPAVVTVTTQLAAQHVNTKPQPGTPGQGPQGQGQIPFDQFFQHFFGPGGPGQIAPGPQRGRPDAALGSGFIIRADGYIVTNNHVIDHATKITVTLDDGTDYPAQLVGADPKTDIAVLKIDASGLPTVPWGDSNAIEVGDQVVAIGNPFGIGTTVTRGIVSARGRDLHNGPYDDFLQVDAAINHGNSGGPLINVAGQVVGIDSAIYSPNDGSVGVGFAIPSDQAKTIVAGLIDKGKIDRGYLGVQIQNVTADIAGALGLPDAHGALVAQVNPDTPAAKAGLVAGDVVISLNGVKITDSRDLSRSVAAIPPGQPSTFGIWRNGAEKDITVTLASLPSAPATPDLNAQQPDTNGTAVPSLGLNLTQLTPDMRQQLGLPDTEAGLIIMGIDSNSPLINVGLKPGDVIASVNTHPVTTLDALDKELKMAADEGKHSVLLMIDRQGKQMFVGVPVGKV